MFSLDRTNFVQDILSRRTLEQYLLLVRREWVQAGALWTHHGELWAENGDALSKIYAGTGALNTSYTRSGKRTLGGLPSIHCFAALGELTESLYRLTQRCHQKRLKSVH